MMALNNDLEKMLENGKRKIAEAARLKREVDKARELEFSAKKQAAIDEFRRYVEELFPGVLEYANLEAAFENFEYYDSRISLPEVIPGFAPIIMAFKRLPALEFEGAKWAMMILARPDPDELGFDVWEEVQPFYTFRNSEFVLDFAVVLARAQEQGALYAGALERWETVKAEFIEQHRRRELEEAEREAIQAGLEAQKTIAIKGGEIECSLVERKFLDAFINYINWLDEEAE